MMELNRVSPFQLSLTLHLAVAILVVTSFWFAKRQKQTIDVNVIVMDQPVLAPQADINLDRSLTKPLPKPEPQARQVFGANRNAIQAAESSDAAIAVKAGNTVAVAPDNEKLKNSDADSVPIPVEEYLISVPPQLLEAFKPKYPAAAKERNIEGAVRVEILIDRQGVVRDAKVIQGLGFGTEEAALEAARKLRFKPAEASGQAVAVKMQFVINFELER